LIDGARQVGKTYIIRYVGNKLFKITLESIWQQTRWAIFFFDSDTGEKKLQF
jgi:hypothetical protein